MKQQPIEEWVKRVKEKYLKDYVFDDEITRSGIKLGMKDRWFTWWIGVIRFELHKAKEEAKRETIEKIKTWVKKTMPITYIVTNLDCNPPKDEKYKAVDKKALLHILSSLTKKGNV